MELFGIRVDPKLRKAIDQMAASEERKPSDFARLLLKREAERRGLLPANASQVARPMSAASH